MVVREYLYKGIPESKLVGLSLDDFKKIVPSRIKRSLERGPTPSQKRFMEKVKRVKEKGITKPLRTHCRNIMIVPEMVGLTIMIYSGKEFIPVEMTAEKLGHYLGEFTLTRKKITHNAPGIGATRSSKFVPLK
jgi:small subunit ribosomal protein S19